MAAGGGIGIRAFSEGGARLATAAKLGDALVEAARRIQIPALLVRGASSELVKEAHAKEFLDLVPHADYVDVGGARHMVAGDRNDRFSAAVLSFIGRLPPHSCRT